MACAGTGRFDSLCDFGVDTKAIETGKHNTDTSAGVSVCGLSFTPCTVLQSNTRIGNAELACSEHAENRCGCCCGGVGVWKWGGSGTDGGAFSEE